MSDRCTHGWRGFPPKEGRQIVTPCPACGEKALFIGDGGHLTCARVPYGRSKGCPSPVVEEAVKAIRPKAEAFDKAVEAMPKEFRHPGVSLAENIRDLAHAWNHGSPRDSIDM